MVSLIEELSQKLGIPVNKIYSILNFSEKFYKKIFLIKKSGEKREINIPSIELKAFQRYFLDNYLYKIPVSNHCYSYKPGENIYNNAMEHSFNNHFLFVDLKDYFNKINMKLLIDMLRKEPIFSEKCDDFFREIEKLCFKGELLSQGSITSPYLSNIYLKEFDEFCNTLALELDDGVYSRYCDDIVISSSKMIPANYKNKIQMQLKKYFLTINNKKTHFQSKKSKLIITGITIDQKNNCHIGTKAKRKLRNMIYHKLNKNPSANSSDEIIGRLMFLKMVEPAYFAYLNEDKYKSMIDEDLIIWLKKN